MSRRWVAGLLAALAAGEARAQTAAAPVLPTRPIEAPDVILPRDDDAPAIRRSASGARAPRIRVDGLVVELQGATVFAEAELAEALSPLLGREISLADLESVRRALTELYLDAGYVSSGVLLPDQVVRDGVVVFRVVEGRLAEIRVSGADVGDEAGPFGQLREAYVVDRIDVDRAAPLNVFEVQERLRRLLNDRNVARVSASIQPTPTLGEAVLDVEVETRRPFDLDLSFDNHSSVSIGDETLRLEGAFRNISGWGDETRAEFEATRGAFGAVASIEAPIGARGPAPFLTVEYAEAEVVEEPFDALDIASDFLRVGAGAELPLVVTSARRVDLDIAFDVKRSRTELLGTPFSFSPGVRDGVSRVSALRFGQSFVDRSANRTVAFRSQFSLGVDLFGATENDGDLPDGSFASWLGQAQAAQRIFDDGLLIARAQAQLASNGLLPIEQVAIGGRSTVRGYRERTLVDDQAAVASIEARLPLLDLRVPWLTPADHDADVIFAPFVDVGAAWPKGGRDDAVFLLGIGAGAIWSPARTMDVSLFFGEPLLERDLASGEGSLQDEGVYFRISLHTP